MKSCAFPIFCRLVVFAVVSGNLTICVRHARGLQILDPTTLTKYLDPLPNPLSNVISPVGVDGGIDLYHVEISQFTQTLHSQLPPTTVWGYNGTYPGPTFNVDSGVPIKVDWVNKLIDGTGTPLPHILPYDDTVHGAWSGFPQSRIVTHLHGGVVEPESDGFPEYWYPGDPNAAANGMGGPAGNSYRDTYNNQQPATTLWYHDHAMGITRLNVYAGLAGFYLLRDKNEAALNLPSGDYEVPLVLQDRSFYDDGQFFYPRGPGDLTDPGGPNPLGDLPASGFTGDASVVPHFLGNTNLVNGVVWPYLEVEPRKYRFRILNGANSRFYDLQLDAGAAGILPFHQIGSDGGLLEATTDRSQMLMAPAERSDVIVDFSSLSVNDEVILRNFAPDGPFESPTATYDPADPNTTGQVMKFRVVAPMGTDTSSLPTSLVSVPRIPESEAIVTRQLSLVDDVDEFGRPKLLLNGAKWTDPTTELPVQGTTEIWEITNSTVGSHPIHLHLVQFQVLDRFARPAGGGDPIEIPLEPYELGWKDTFKVNRRETVRVIARFEDFDGLYVWHCHILEHEDHEMMRRYEVVPAPELIVEQGVTLSLTDPHTVPGGYYLTVNGTFVTPQLSVDGLLRGTGVVASSVTVTGDVNPGGDDAGVLSITGNMTLLSSSKLAIEITSTGAGQFDVLDVAGQAILDGLLSVKLFDIGQGGTYVPALGDTFEILTAAGGVTGAFDLDVRTTVAGGLGLETLYGANSVQLVVVSDLAGDYNNDGTVDAADYVVWRKNNGTTINLPNDPFGGTIGSAQYATWRSNFGKTLTSGAANGNVVVPEPAGVLLLAMASTIFSCFIRRRRRSAILLFAIAATSLATEASAAQVSLTPLKDNTLYQSATGSQSNGAGSYLFAGRTDASSEYLRRAVMAFDVAGNIPAGSIIQSAALTLTMSRTKVGAMTFDLHRLTSNWGQGTSNADAQEGAGAASTTNDATWIHTFYPSSFWATSGGDFSPTISASASVGGNGSYTWGTTAQMVSDVQSWLNNPASNYGWLLQGPEGVRSAKRFNSGENSTASTRPSLVIQYISGGPTILSWIGTGSGGSFHDPANWDAGRAPSLNTDTARLINTSATPQVATMSSNVTIDDLTINGDTNSMTLSIGQGVTANVSDLNIGHLGGLGIPLASGSFGKLNASGPATLAGTLALSTPGPIPSPTASFQFLTYASRTGRFNTITGYEIVPGQSFSLHYNNSRALAIAGQWAAAGQQLAGEFDVPQNLVVSGAWNWNGLLVKRGAGELALDLSGGFSTTATAAIAIVDGTVRLTGAGYTLSLDSLTFGELGLLSGQSSLAGLYGWYGNVMTAPEPTAGLLFLIGIMAMIKLVRPRSRSSDRILL